MFSKYHSYSRNAFSEIDGGNSEEQVPSILPTIQTKVEVEGIVSKAPVPTASVFNTSLYTNYAIQNISLPSFVCPPRLYFSFLFLHIIMPRPAVLYRQKRESVLFYHTFPVLSCIFLF